MTPDTPLGLNGSEALQALEQIQGEERDEAESEYRVGIDGLALLALFVDAAPPVDQPLDRRERAVAGSSAVAVHAGHVATERRGRDDDGDGQGDELRPGSSGHQNLSGNIRAATR